MYYYLFNKLKIINRVLKHGKTVLMNVSTKCQQIHIEKDGS